MLFESKFSLQIFNTKFQWIWELHKFPSCSDMWMGGELEENKKPAPFLSPPLRSFLRNFTNSKTIGHLKEIMVRPSVQEVKKWYFSSWQVVLNPHPRVAKPPYGHWPCPWHWELKYWLWLMLQALRILSQLIAAPVIPPKKQVKSSTAPLGGRSTY